MIVVRTVLSIGVVSRIVVAVTRGGGVRGHRWSRRGRSSSSCRGSMPIDRAGRCSAFGRIWWFERMVDVFFVFGAIDGIDRRRWMGAGGFHLIARCFRKVVRGSHGSLQVGMCFVCGA